MSLPTIKEGLSAIAGEVLADAQKEAQTIIAQAKANAKQTLQKGKQEADRTYDTLIEVSTAQTDMEVRRMQSLTDVEARNLLLQVKETMIEAAYRTALEQMRLFTQTELYHNYLLKSVQEAAEKVESKQVTIQVNASDKTWLKTKTKELSEKLGVDLTLSRETGQWMGGCKAQSQDQTRIYDNTIETRLQQLWPELRIEVAKLLFTEVT
jgi:V/A-type H+-transporting ATPase subunit E